MPWPPVRTIALLSLSLAFSSCQQAEVAGLPTTIIAAAPSATASPASTETPAATATLTVVAITRPSPTSIPTVSPSPAPRLQSAISIEPARVAQGKTTVVRVRGGTGIRTEGTLDGATLAFAQAQGEAWAAVGIGGLARLGTREVQVRLTDAAGGVTMVRASFEVTASDWPVEDIILPPGQGGLLAPAIVVDEFALLRMTSQRATGAPRWQGRFIRPAAGEESSPYGTRRSYNGGPPAGQHEGMDFAINAGDPIRAAASGSVAVAQALQVRGNAILIDHGGGVATGYYHLSEMLVKEGQDVSAGALIGRGGATGLATGPHLHWDVIIGGVNVDPAEWLDRAFP